MGSSPCPAYLTSVQKYELLLLEGFDGTTRVPRNAELLLGDDDEEEELTGCGCGCSGVSAFLCGWVLAFPHPHGAGAQQPQLGGYGGYGGNGATGGYGGKGGYGG